MKCFRPFSIIIIASILVLTSQAGALVTGKDKSVTTSTARTPPVVLETGNKGSSSLSSTSDYGSVTATASLAFNEVEDATVSTLSVPALDGSANASFPSSTSGACNFSTGTANGILYVIVSIQGTNDVSSVTDSGSLTWSRRGAVTDGSNERVEAWFAIAPTAAAHNITVHFASSTTFEVVAFGISRANTVQPFDPNLSSPVVGTGSGASQSVSVSTTNPNDLLIGAIAVSVPSGEAPTPIDGTGFTSIDRTSNAYLAGSGEYSVVTAPQSSASVSYSTGATSVNWAMIGDAVQGNLPSVANDTSLSAPSSSGSFTVAAGSSAFLWSPAYPSATTVCSGSWLLDLWTSGTSSGTMGVLLLVVDSSNAVTALVASGSTGTIGTSESEVKAAFSGSQATVPTNGRLLAILTNPTGSGVTFTIYWGTGQVTNFRTPSCYDYVMRIANSASSDYSVSLSVYSSSSISRITSMAVYIHSPNTTEIAITNGALSQSSGPTLTLPASSTLYIGLSANASAFGSSSVVLLLSISPGSKPFSYDVVALTVN